MALRGDPVFRSLASVIGSSHETQLPLSYVERRPVEEMFTRALAARTHIAVFGTPGVGKSALVRHNVDWAHVFFVECLDGQRAPDVYRSMLSEAGARIKTETKLSNKRRLSGTLKVFSGELERDSENTETEITVDLGNVGDVFRILRSRSRPGTFVVLNNFHVLARPVQRRIVGSLQYVSEHTDTRFIIVGNWASPAYLTDLNSLLPSFVTDIHVAPWPDEELMSVLHKVEQLMNVTFAADVATELIRKSAGSVRELMDSSRNLLSVLGVLGVMASPQPARIIDEIETLREVSVRTESRLHERYAALLSRFLTARLYSVETVDVSQFLDTVADDLMNKPGTRRTGNAQARRYSSAELQLAMRDAMAAFNDVKQAERARRLRLLGELMTVIRRQEGSGVSVTLRSLVDDSAGGVAEYYALRESAKKLIRLQAKYGFHPPLLAYDPHGGALIALEPKFRAFLRNESVSLESLQRDHMRPVTWRLKSSAWWVKDKWHDPIAEAAAIRRSQAQATAPVPRARS